MRISLLTAAALGVATLCGTGVRAYGLQPRAGQDEAAAPKSSAMTTIAIKTAGMRRMDGFVPLDWDAKTGRIYLEVRHLGEDLLLTHSLPHGVGSNDLGLDRGQIEPLSGGVSPSRVVRFERSGPKVLLLQPNLMFRSSAKDEAEQRSVRESFAESVVWGFKVEAEDADGGVLLDATDWVLHDVHGVDEVLRGAEQGAYKVDTSRSTVEIGESGAFPKNSAIGVLLTLTTDDADKARFVRDVTPDPRAVTVHERVGFVELPAMDGTFKSRRFDPRSGYFNVGYRDYAVPLGGDLDQRLIERHRLVKKDANCRARCVAVNPIQYYVDRGAPEPVRSALVEGARWWDGAFEAAGWAPGTFKVDVLPENADPMDVRYNMIQWVHRYTRGWSYGESVIDPRTGEVLKGNVTLGSLRGRQDYLIAEALLSPYKDGKTPQPDPMLAMVLQRIRQLAAHETGHTLGLAHNYVASSTSQSDSVMDYPHPLVRLGKDGRVELSHAYAVGIGAWDKVAIDYGYRDFAAGVDEGNALREILTSAERKGEYFITDEDARPVGSAHPRAHLWDNGPDAAAELDRVLEVRAAALKQFGDNAMKTGEPLSEMERTLAPLYLFHRYQTEAATKEIGGLVYRYNVRGGAEPLPEIVPGAEQRKALQAVLRTLSAETLTLPEELLRQMPPVAFGYPRTRESLPGKTGLTFDPVGAAEAAADLTLRVLFNGERAARLVQYHAREASVPGLGEVVDAALKAAAARPQGTGLDVEVARAVEARTLEALLTLAADATSANEVRTAVRGRLAEWAEVASTPSSPEERAQHVALVARVQAYLRGDAQFAAAPVVEAPPGMPIGDEDTF